MFNNYGLNHGLVSYGENNIALKSVNIRGQLVYCVLNSHGYPEYIIGGGAIGHYQIS
jgi:hypothetical protein